MRFAGAVAGAFLVLSAWALLEYWGLGKAPFHTKGEPREALVVWEVVHTGDWILPLRNGIELPSKPPMFHWLGALASLAHGRVDEWSVRLPSTLLSGAAALGTYAVGVSFWGPRAGLLAALGLLGSFEWARAATNARVDMSLSFGVTLSMLALLLIWRRERPLWLLLFYAGMVWAVLSKGPVGIALPFLQVCVLSVYTMLTERGFCFARRLHLTAGLTAVAAIAGLWYGLALAHGGREFFVKQVLEENVFRLLGHAGGHQHSAGYLLATLLTGLLPWTVLLPALATPMTGASVPAPDSAPGRQPGRRSPALFLTFWCVIVFGFYAPAQSKRSVYLLALYPAFFLLLGRRIDAALRARSRNLRGYRSVAPLAWLTAGLYGLAACALLLPSGGFPLRAALLQLLGPVSDSSRNLIDAAIATHGILAALLFAAAGAAAATALALRAARPGLAFAFLFALFAAANVATRQVILPQLARREARSQTAVLVKQRISSEASLSSYRGFDYGMAYYSGGRIPVYDESDLLNGPPYLVMAERAWQRLPIARRGSYEQVNLPGTGWSPHRLILLQRTRPPGS